MLILVVILLLVSSSSSSSSTAIIVVFSTMIFSCFRNLQFLMFLMMEEDDGLLEDFHFYLFVSRYALSDPSLRFLRF
jgi:hypothetical protein